MEINPVIGIRVMPAVKVPPAETGITAFFDIEATAQLGDDSYTGAGKKAAGAEESEEEKIEDLDKDTDDGPDSETEGWGTIRASAHASSAGVSYFA